MRKIKVLGIVGLLTGTALSVMGNAEKETLNNWEKAVFTNDFKKTLTSVKSLKEDWPAIHSVKHKENNDGEKASLQTGYRDTTRTFLQGLEKYEKELRNMSPEAFCEGANALLDVRERFMKHPSYVNYFLVDSINRVIYINLGERLIKIGDVPTCYDRVVERLAEFRLTWLQLYELAGMEYRTNQISSAEFEKLSCDEQIEAVEELVGLENFYFVVPDAHNLYNLRILDTRSLTALLTRLIGSDTVIGSLPALLTYRRKAADFALTDSWEQTRVILKDEASLAPTLLDERPRASGVVDELLRGIQSEEWRMTLYFSEMPGLTQEILERAEKREAEREAKREANH